MDDMTTTLDSEEVEDSVTPPADILAKFIAEAHAHSEKLFQASKICHVEAALIYLMLEDKSQPVNTEAVIDAMATLMGREFSDAGTKARVGTYLAGMVEGEEAYKKKDHTHQRNAGVLCRVDSATYGFTNAGLLSLAKRSKTFFTEHLKAHSGGGKINDEDLFTDEGSAEVDRLLASMWA